MPQPRTLVVPSDNRIKLSASVRASTLQRIEVAMADTDPPTTSRSKAIDALLNAGLDALKIPA